MSKLLHRVVSDAATRVSQARSGGRPVPEMQRADTVPESGLTCSPLLQQQTGNNGSEYREMLLRQVKREVKQLMEESVTKKFIHEESSIITTLCASVENCIQYGLKRTSVSVFRDNLSYRLLQKIAKDCPEARSVLDRMAATETDGGSGGLASLASSGGLIGKDGGKKPSQNVKYQWIRVALLEKLLNGIVEHLVKRCKQYYETDSIIADPCDGPLLASLLVGPCALEYTKVKMLDHFYTDPSADELLQRHRIHTPIGSPNSPKAARTPSLKDDVIWLKRLSNLLASDSWSGTSCCEAEMIKRHPSTSSEESLNRSAPASAKEYVELLHQNTRSLLLFGKNNVQSQTASLSKRVAGYLSLHQGSSGLVVKWTPNALMLGGGGGGGGAGGGGSSGSASDVTAGATNSPTWLPANAPHSPCAMGYSPQARRPVWAMQRQQQQQPSTPPPPQSSPMKAVPSASSLVGGGGCGGSDSPNSPASVGSEVYDTRWEAAITVHVEDMVYIHCHSSQQEGSSLVFVAQDGTQVPPLIFPPGGHLLQFLTCLENGLLPNGSLDPPLWSHKNKGKVFPQMKRKSILKDTFLAGLLSQDDDSDSNEPVDSEAAAAATPSDLVFRIVYRNSRFSFESTESSASNDSAFVWQETKQQQQQQQQQQPQNQQLQRRMSIRRLCDSMRRQILSRAFYGWLAHVRHSRTVRRHLASLLCGSRDSLGTAEAYPQGLTKEILARGRRDEICQAVYWGGCPPQLRKKVWPLLLGLRSWDATDDDAGRQDRELQMRFENLLSDWSPLDVIVREDAKESATAAREELQRKLTAAQSSAGKEKQQQQQQSSSKQQPRQESVEDSGQSTTAGVAVEIEDSEGQQSRTASTSTATNAGESSALQSSDSGFQSSSLPLAPDLPPDSSSRLSTSRESLVSPASPASNGGVYSPELIELISLNWHRIDKDVMRCDRHIPFYARPENLESLRNIMCSYVWQNIEVGYIQGFCDLLAPLLIVMEDEWLALGSFAKLMDRMIGNFPAGESAADYAGPASPMDRHMANLRALMQVTDPHLYEHLLRRGDYTEFYFFHRWFLLDFKREFYYNDIFLLWETIWAAWNLISGSFNVFIAMALLREYRGVIMDNNMDFTDIIKFYNEVAERHNVNKILRSARDLVNQLIELVENQ